MLGYRFRNQGKRPRKNPEDRLGWESALGGNFLLCGSGFENLFLDGDDIVLECPFVGAEASPVAQENAFEGSVGVGFEGGDGAHFPLSGALSLGADLEDEFVSVAAVKFVEVFGGGGSVEESGFEF